MHFRDGNVQLPLGAPLLGPHSRIQVGTDVCSFGAHFAFYVECPSHRPTSDEDGPVARYGFVVRHGLRNMESAGKNVHS